MKRLLCLCLLCLLIAAAMAGGSESPRARVKDLVAIEGVRDNQLIGYGLVVGLAGTGDRKQTVFSAQSLANALQRMGVTVSPDAIRVNNTASVTVTATLPPFAQPGTRIDLTVAAIGDASNLQGGLLLLTPLTGADGRVYAVAQGPVVTGGFVAGRGGNSQTLNHPTVGRVPNGAIVEHAAPSVAPGATMNLQLKRADFSMSSRVAAAINQRFGEGAARPAHAALIAVNLPAAYRERAVDFLAELETLTVEGVRSARVIVNERTGTVVMGKEVTIAPVAILHGGLSIAIQTAFEVSQPQPLAAGTTEVVPKIDVTAREERARNVMLPEGATVEELIRALNAIGSTARDIIAILQSLQAAGALAAEVEVI